MLQGSYLVHIFEVKPICFGVLNNWGFIILSQLGIILIYYNVVNARW